MTYKEAMDFIQGKLNCMKKCGVFNKEDSIRTNCDDCEYCYTQGNFGEQLEAFELAVNALNDVYYSSQQQFDIQILKKYIGNGTQLWFRWRSSIWICKKSRF